MTELHFILGSVLQSHQVSKNRRTWYHVRYQRVSTSRVTPELFPLAANRYIAVSSLRCNGQRASWNKTFRASESRCVCNDPRKELAERFISLQTLGSNKNDGCTAPGVAAEPK